MMIGGGGALRKLASSIHHHFFQAKGAKHHQLVMGALREKQDTRAAACDSEPTRALARSGARVW